VDPCASSHRACVVSQRLCVGPLRQSPLMRVEKNALLHIEALIYCARYRKFAMKTCSMQDVGTAGLTTSE
jgi:hypothetical protein